nr:MAG TPA: hypothetical protein [Caudoviricetes sp.]DAM66037.1 MAG TPA: hypothetical protein [Caudoviricetes sp.]
MTIEYAIIASRCIAGNRYFVWIKNCLENNLSGSSPHFGFRFHQRTLFENHARIAGTGYFHF